MKKSFAKILYERRIYYGRLCKMNITNNNLRLNKSLNFEEFTDKMSNLNKNKKSEEKNEINLSLNENNLELIKTERNKNIKISDLKINLMGDFREEIEKVFYDSKLQLDPPLLKREIRLKKMLSEKIKRLNYLTNNH